MLAIMGILIGLIATSVNRFNEQLKMTGEISQELNEWFAFRSNLWSELYQCDSIQQQDAELHLYTNDRLVKYKLDGEDVIRSMGNEWQLTRTKAESIRLETIEERMHVVFDFIWKGEIMSLNYYFEPELSAQINRHFDELE